MEVLRRALRTIASEPEIELTAVSRFYRTPPWGKTDQDWFVNACALGRTSLEPKALLERVKTLEVELGRAPAARWGPRVIDIDLIAYDELTLKSERLTLPHPELFHRAFVLAPWHALDPAARLPCRGPVAALLAGLGQDGVRRQPDMTLAAP